MFLSAEVQSREGLNYTPIHCGARDLMAVRDPPLALIYIIGPYEPSR